MQLMTITYLDGTVLKAIVLSHEERKIRAAAGGCDDVLVFTRIDGTWISEVKEPVTIEFEWQRRGETPSCFEDDYICPKELAARLISTVLGEGEQDEAVAHTFYVFSADGACVSVHHSELKPS
jgi:hypothetical protein